MAYYERTTKATLLESIKPLSHKTDHAAVEGDVKSQPKWHVANNHTALWAEILTVWCSFCYYATCWRSQQWHWSVLQCLKHSQSSQWFPVPCFHLLWYRTPRQTTIHENYAHLLSAQLMQPWIIILTIYLYNTQCVFMYLSVPLHKDDLSRVLKANLSIGLCVHCSLFFRIKKQNSKTIFHIRVITSLLLEL